MFVEAMCRKKKKKRKPIIKSRKNKCCIARKFHKLKFLLKH